MTRLATGLPAGFEALEPYVERWARPTTAERARSRDEASAADRAAFYEAARDLLSAALDLLDRKPLDSLDAAERRLMDLMLGLGHVVLATEVQGAEEDCHRDVRLHMRIRRSPADEPARPGAGRDAGWAS